jgi:alpha-tubulin suppressor-like RCC1 family protein
MASGCIHTPGNVYDPNNVTPCSPGGPFYITNVSATLLTNGTTTVSFDIFGGTNGVFYDIFATSSLNNSLASNEWLWIGQGLTCNSFTFTNQPADQSFYTLELPAETFTIPFDGDNDYGQLDIPFGVSNAIAIAGGGYFSLALRNNGTVLGWGDNDYGETNIPAGLSNVVGIAAGLYHGVAVLANGSVTNWGYYWDGDSYYASVTNRTYASAPPTSNVVAVAAGMGQDLALLSNGTVVAWGFTNVYGTGAAFGTLVPTNLNLTNVSAIACGWQFNLALSSNGTVTAWGYNDPLFGYPTNVPSDLTNNAVAIAAGAGNAVALRKNGTVEAWGDQYSGVTNVPAGLTNVVTVATGGAAGLALRSDGSVVAWGDDSLTNIPVGMIGVKAISTGFDHNMVIESGLLAPVIFTQPTDQYAPTNGTVTFSAAGEGVAGIQYQWQFNGVNLTGATNATLTLTNTQATNQGSYQVIISTDFGSITSSMATFTLVVAPVIVSTAPTNTGIIWFNYDPTLSISAYAADPSGYPLGYSWKLNGTNLAGAASHSYTIPTLAPTNEGTYAVTVTNVAGSTNAAWNMRLALPGMVEAWGDDDYGESDRPAGLTNVAGIAAGEYQSVAVTDSGTVVQWGQYWDGVDFYSVTNTNYVTLPPTSNVVAVAAGLTQALALMNDGTVRAWGLDGAYGTEVPSGLSNVTAIACGWQFNVALLANGTVTSWGDDFFGQTNVPAGLSNVVAIAAGAQHTLALLSNGTVRAWGDGDDGDTNIPTGLTNVVAIAAGESHNLALISTNGSVVAWGLNNYGQTNVPAGLSNVMALAAGDSHSVALKNDGTLVEWGDNSSGQTNVPGELPTIVITTSGGITPTFTTNIYPSIVVKLIAAGGDHTMAAITSPLIQYYPINVSKDLLLIYNATNVSFSSNVCAYYMANRPLVSGANLLGITCPTNEIISPSDYTNYILTPVTNWLATNATKRPAYVVLFQDIPSRVNLKSPTPSLQYELHTALPTWSPFITSINMNGAGGTNDCIGYINRLTNMAGTNQTLFISATVAQRGNTNWYFDDAQGAYSYIPIGFEATEGVESNGVPSSAVTYTPFTNAVHITRGTNVAGYFTWGVNGGLTNTYATDGTISFSGSKQWYLIATAESFNGQRITGQGNFLDWCSGNAFGGTSYSNTPIAAISHVDEPDAYADNAYNYFGFWASGKCFAIAAWVGQVGTYPAQGVSDFWFQAVGDPFVRK